MAHVSLGDLDADWHLSNPTRTAIDRTSCDEIRKEESNENFRTSAMDQKRSGFAQKSLKGYSEMRLLTRYRTLHLPDSKHCCVGR